MILVGVDPGAKGAWAVLDDGQPTHVADIPTRGKGIDPVAWFDDLKWVGPDLIVIEHVGPMPKQGVVSVFGFGRTVGQIHTVAELVAEVDVMTPQVWKRQHMMARTKGESKTETKNRSRELALALFPMFADHLRLKKHADRAEALLIGLAYWEMNVMTDKCRSCDRPLVWALTESKQLMPVDAEPVEDGNLLMTVEGGRARVEVVGPLDVALLDDPVLYQAHFRSCLQADQWRK